jgi:hypothetical protein
MPLDIGNGVRKGSGVYELEGDTMKLLVNHPGERRATRFRGEAKGMLFFLKLEGK